MLLHALAKLVMLPPSPYWTHLDQRLEEATEDATAACPWQKKKLREGNGQLYIIHGFLLVAVDVAIKMSEHS